MRKKKTLLYIEEQFTEIMLNRKGDNSRNLRSIERILKNEYKLNVTLDVIENRHSMFFGMSVYPVNSVMDRLVKKLVQPESRSNDLEEIWSKNNDWIIEIDSMSLYDPTLSLNPQELTAMLLHEIGHTVYANTVPQRIFKVSKYSIMGLSINTKKMLDWEGTTSLLKLPIIQACNQKMYRLYSNYEEYEADKFAVKQGYGDGVKSMMDKVILRFEGIDLMENEGDREKGLQSLFGWSIDAIQNLAIRRDKVEKMLNKQAQKTVSVYTIQIIDEINRFLLGNYEDLVSDIPEKFKKTFRRERNLKQYTDYQNRPMIVQEGFKDWFSKDRKLKPIHGSDVDVINIEIDKIDNESDRIFVLDMVYHRLDNVRHQLEILEDGTSRHTVKTPKSQLLRFEEDLLDMRKRILSIKIPPKQYGVIIRYPKTYEG